TNGTTKPDLTLTSVTNLTHFGYKLFALDVNNDGFQDLVIGNPMSCQQWLTEQEKDANELQCRQCGNTVVFLSAKKWSNVSWERQHPIVYVNESDAILTNNIEFEWFGYHIDMNGDNTLFISAPGARNQLLNTTGCIYVYDIRCSNSNNNCTFTLIYKINGEQNIANSDFGYFFAFGNPYVVQNTDAHYKDILAIASPSETFHLINRSHDIDIKSLNEKAHGGVVRFFNVTKMLSMNEKYANESLLLTLVCDQEYARLGYFTLFKDINGDAIDDIILSAPYYVNGKYDADNYNITSANFTRESGSVFTWYGGMKGIFRREENDRDKVVYDVYNTSDLMFVGDIDKSSRLGFKIAINTNNVMVFSAHRATVDGKEMAGKVFVEQL
ncbi:hypothetical protein RFI_21826, partial [Reticulomyxa filosa]